MDRRRLEADAFLQPKPEKFSPVVHDLITWGHLKEISNRIQLTIHVFVESPSQSNCPPCFNSRWSPRASRYRRDAHNQFSSLSLAEDQLCNQRNKILGKRSRGMCSPIMNTIQFHTIQGSDQFGHSPFCHFILPGSRIIMSLFITVQLLTWVAP